MRREEQLLLDMLEDRDFCHALFQRVSEHLTQVALEELRRSNSWDVGIWFYDDSASLRAPMFSPSLWERYLLPLYSKMISELRIAGCRHFYLHSDGNIAPFLPLMLEAGFEGFNPLEPRCMDIFELRKRFGNRMVLFGGMCNTRVLPSGNRADIERMVKGLVELGRDGGLVIGSASIGDDISPESYDYYIQTVEQYSAS
jgi:uroporphyrinogen decarboxylase